MNGVIELMRGQLNIARAIPLIIGVKFMHANSVMSIVSTNVVSFR